MTDPRDPRPVTGAAGGAVTAGLSTSDLPSAPNDPRGAGPIPKEIPVVATGAHSCGGSGSKELFCEDTTTVLVFEKGAVIRLSVAVVPGQLIFLTNLETKKEVVAQVMLQQGPQTNNTYSDLQFTEQAADFWSVAFPKDSAPAANGSTGADLATLELAAPAKSEVAELRSEVEELRRKVASLPQHAELGQEKRSPEPQQSAKRADEPANELRHSAQDPEAVSTNSLTAAVLAAASAAPPQATKRDALPTMILPKAKSRNASSPSHVQAGEELGSLVHGGEDLNPQTREGEVLPEASLDYDGAQAATENAGGSVRSPMLPIPAGGGIRKLRVASLAGFLVICLLATAWYEHWLPFSSAAKRPTPEMSSFAGTTAPSSASAAQRPSPAVVATATPQAESGAASGPAQPASASENVPDATDEADKRLKAEPGNPASEEAAKETDAAATNHNSYAKERAQEGESSARLGRSSKFLRVSPARGPFVPPKLLKTVRAVAPAAAIREYVTGNVEVKAEVGTNGRVTSAKATSGPDALLQAAVATVRKYKYAPATRGGEPVTAEVKVTVQFWYEP